jgi:hypothetical protein
MVEMAADTAEGNAIFLKLPIDESIDETDWNKELVFYFLALI